MRERPRFRIGTSTVISIAAGLCFALGPPRAVGAADCNGNGIPDETDISRGSSEDCNGNLVPDECEGDIAPFGGRITALPAAGLEALVVEDFDGDGRQDLATGDTRVELGVSVLLNRGGRDFERRPAVGDGHIRALAAADLDGDGDLDLVGVERGAFHVLSNRGEGEFQTSDVIEFGDRLNAIIAVDLGGDGRPDVAAVDLDGDAVWLLAGGEEGFGPPVRYSSGDDPYDVAAIDVESDGDVDLVTANWESSDLSVLINDGAAGFTPAARLDPGVEGPRSLVADDLDGDGRLDIAVASRRQISVLFGGVGGLREPVVIFGDSNGGLGLNGITIADLDGNGTADLVASHTSGVMLVANDGRGGFTPWINVELGPSVTGTRVADLDNDGRLDLLGFLDGTLAVAWYGRVRASVTFTNRDYPVNSRPHWTTLGDVDGDGDLDVATGGGFSGCVTVLLNDGVGVFALRRTVADFFTAYINAITAADVDGDGRDDLAVAGAHSAEVFVIREVGGARQETEVYKAGMRPTYIAAGDLTSDGFPELVTANRSENSASVFVNTGDGRFEPARRVPVAAGPHSVALGDLDGDGHVDIAAAGATASRVSLHFNRGDAMFERVASFSSPAPGYVVPADLDGDGDLDLAVSSQLAGVSVFENDGDGEFTFRLALPDSDGSYGIVVRDISGDGLLDIATANRGLRSVFVFPGRGGMAFEPPPFRNDVGTDPRALVAGDLDGDGDDDLVTGNWGSNDVSVLINQVNPTSSSDRQPYLERICTPRDFHGISLPAHGGSRRRVTKWVAPARDDPAVLPPLFQNVRLTALHQEFLAAHFPERFPALTAEVYDRLVNRRATREYFIGNLYRLESARSVRWGFSVFTGYFDDRDELPEPEEIASIHATLGEVFTLEPLVYYPDSRLPREDTASWGDIGVPVVLEEEEPEHAYEAYTRGVAFGRVRILDPAAFERANSSGEVSFQDVLVLDEPPRDVEGVIAAVVTARPQGELSHLAVRTSRRGTPNAYAIDARARFGPFEGALVRVEVGELDLDLRAASAEEAAAWEAERRPPPARLPELDRDFAALSSLTEIDLSPGAVPAEARFGGKAANMARLQGVLEGPFEVYREPGFAIPVRYSLRFLEANTIESALEPGREVTYAAYLAELLADDAFASDPALRFRLLESFREHAVEHGDVDPALVRSVALRVASVFRWTTSNVRLRSSSNVEDGLEFNGAGLYDSTSACAADDLDSEDFGPSRCDALRRDERGIARGLRRVWASLWNFRAHEERAFYRIPQDEVAMAVLVTRAFTDERANGVAFTGNPSNPFDSRYVVSAQRGEASVVRPDPGTLAEKSLLDVSGGEVVSITRAVRSSLVPPGEVVLEDDLLRELGRLLWHLDETFPVDTGAHRREDVLLDIEFKVDSDGSLAVKQVRPFLPGSPELPAPSFELAVAPGTEACGTFVPFRSPQATWELKSAVRFVPGTHELPTRRDRIEGIELIEELRLGPERAVATPAAPGRLRVERKAGKDTTSYELTYTQEFTLAGGAPFTLELRGLAFEARGGEPLGEALDLAAALASGALVLEGRLGPEGTVIPYAPCTHEDLPLWEITVALDDGSSLRLLERHDPPRSLEETGPAELVGAELSLGGVERAVESYWDLVYTAVRHNRSVRHRVVLDPPAVVPGLERALGAVEVTAPEPFFGTEAAASYLDAGFEPIASPRVLSYIRRRADAPIPRFRRGDADANERITLTDAVFLLDHLFRRRREPPCRDAADTNDDGRLNLSDPIAILDRLFRGAAPLPPPADACGEDPTPDNLDCARAPPCTK